MPFTQRLKEWHQRRKVKTLMTSWLRKLPSPLVSLRKPPLAPRRNKKPHRKLMRRLMCLRPVGSYRYSMTQLLSMIKQLRVTEASLSSKVANRLTNGITESIRTTTNSFRSGMEAAIRPVRRLRRKL